MIERIEPSAPPACEPCKLSIYCDVQKQLFFSVDAPYKALSPVEAEAEQIIVAANINKDLVSIAQLDEEYEAWKASLRLKFVGDTAGLEKALGAVDSLYASTRINRLRVELQADANLTKAVHRAIDNARKAEAIDVEIALRDESCPGLREKNVGWPFARRTLEICGLANTPEFTMIQALKNADDDRAIAARD